MLTRYHPWSALHRLQADASRLFDDAETRAWIPAVDVREEDERFVIAADVPGVDPADIEVTMKNGVLTIRGERVLETRGEPSGTGYRRAERRRGAFLRRFALPDTVDPEGVSAEGRNGVLEVVVPKRAAVQPRRIKVAA